MAEALECLGDFKGKFPEQARSSACDALERDIKAALFIKAESGGKRVHVEPVTLTFRFLMCSIKVKPAILHK